MFNFKYLINIAEMTKCTKMLRYGYFGPLNWTSRLGKSWKVGRSRLCTCNHYVIMRVYFTGNLYIACHGWDN